ncbi:MAG: MoaD/ThiS family protein [bacterium]|nr:MoaD/ThiS family protein [bacterium]
MKIRVLFFAMLREKFRKDEGEFNALPGETVQAFTERLLIPQLDSPQAIKSLFFAVNQEYVAKDYILKEGDELALIPPVAGG